MISSKRGLCKTIVICVMALLFVVFPGINAKAAVPAQITGFKQTALSAGQNAIALSWTAQKQTGIRYEIQISKGNTAAFSQAAITNANKITIKALDAGTTYYFRIRALAGTQTGVWSANLKTVTAPQGRPAKVIQSAAAETAITIKWNKVKGADGYLVKYKSTGAKSEKKVYVKAGSVTLKKLSRNAGYTIAVYAYRQDGTPVRAISSQFTKPQAAPVTLPTRPIGTKLYLSKEIAGIYQFKINPKKSADGLQFQVRTSQNKSVVIGTASFQKTALKIASTKIKRNQFYKLRIRGYVNIGTKKVYGAWSSDLWFAGEPMMKSYQKSTTGFKLTWAKTTGATNYTVYISTKQSSGYKKVGTTTKTSITIKKYGQQKLVKGKNYYVYAVANRKVGRTIYKGADTTTYRLKYK